MRVGDVVAITQGGHSAKGLTGTVTDVLMSEVVRKAKGRNLGPMCADGAHDVETQTDGRGKPGRWCTKCGHRAQMMQLLTVDGEHRVLSCYVRRLTRAA